MRRRGQPHVRRFGGAALASVAVLLLGLAGTGLAAHDVTEAGSRGQAMAADRYGEQARTSVEAEMRRYRDTVQAVAASLSAQSDLRAADFAAVTRPLLDARLAGASAVALVVPATDDQVAGVQQFWRREGATGLTLHPEAGSTTHEFVIFNRTLDGLPSKLGLDLSTSPQLRRVTARATSRDDVTLSESYVLFKDRALPADRRQLSFVLVMPVTTPSGAPRGWLVMALRGGDLLRGTLRDTTQGQANVTLTSGSGVVAQQFNGPATHRDLIRTSGIPLADQRWTLTTQPTDATASRDSGGDRALVLLLGGVAFSLSLALVAYLLVTSRRRAMEAVDVAESGAARQAALLSAVMDSLSDGVGAVDQNGAFMLHNPAAHELLGGSEDVDDPDQWQNHYGLYLPDGVTPFPTAELPLVQALGGQAKTDVEMVIRRTGSDSVTPISVSARPLDPASGISGAVAIFHDLTTIKAFQSELADRAADLEVANRLLERRNTELGEANKELEAFSYTVSHDLRAPLRAITAFSTLVLRDHAADLDQKAHHYLTRTSENAVALNALIDDLLTFSRTLRSDLRKGLTPLATVVHAAWDDVTEARTADSTGSTGSTGSADSTGSTGPVLAEPELLVGDLPSVAADASLLKQVFINLLTNAVKFSPPDRSLLVTVEVGPDPAGSAEPVITVRDNGMGFDPAQAERIFGVFQRLNPGEAYEGTGIGLSIVQRIVTRHGGRVWATATPGEGAAFSFTLGPDTAVS